MAVTEGLRQLAGTEKIIKRRQKMQRRMQRLKTMFGGGTPRPRRKVA